MTTNQPPDSASPGPGAVPPAEQDDTANPTPSTVRPAVLAGAVLALLTYLCGFFGAYEFFFPLILVLAGGLLALIGLLPKVGRVLVPSALLASTGFFLLLLSVTSTSSIGSSGAVRWIALALGLLSAAAIVAALMFDVGVLTAPAPRPRTPVQQPGWNPYGPPGQAGYGAPGQPQQPGQGGVFDPGHGAYGAQPGYGAPGYPAPPGYGAPGYPAPPGYGAPGYAQPGYGTPGHGSTSSTGGYGAVGAGGYGGAQGYGAQGYGSQGYPGSSGSSGYAAPGYGTPGQSGSPGQTSGPGSSGKAGQPDAPGSTVSGTAGFESAGPKNNTHAGAPTLVPGGDAGPDATTPGVPANGGDSLSDADEETTRSFRPGDGPGS